MRYDLYSAFGNRIRVKLLLCLSKSPKNVSGLIENCGLAQSAVSQHLTKLKAANLVVCKKNGKQKVYSLKIRKIGLICKMLEEIRKEVI